MNPHGFSGTDRVQDIDGADLSANPDRLELVEALKRTSVVTQWSHPVDASEPDPDRHRAFAAFALEMTRQHEPGLFRFLVSTGSKVVVGNGFFLFSLPFKPDAWFDMPEMAKHLQLLPWAEPHEVAH